MVCEISYRQLSDEAREKLNVLIDNQEFRDEHGDLRYPSFNHGCLREDQVRNRPIEHYINYPRNWARVEDAECPNGRPCLLSAIELDIARLSDTSLPNDVRLAAALALGHWIGDIHQPLHVSFKDDRGGNSIRKRGRCGTQTLHGVWDRCLVERRVIFIREPADPEDYAVFTPMYRAADWMIDDVEDADAAVWVSSQPWEWAAESFDLVRQAEIQYCIMKDDECWYSETQRIYDGNEDNERTVYMNEQYLDEFGPDVILRLTQAGFRLAATLESALAD
ncbi:MAG: S1/P1 nuclease [Magnetovibrio sp.]|nr:S1/P1 nuclease [Magnetovibrio sp.]